MKLTAAYTIRPYYLIFQEDSNLSFYDFPHCLHLKIRLTQVYKSTNCGNYTVHFSIEPHNGALKVHLHELNSVKDYPLHCTGMWPGVA